MRGMLVAFVLVVTAAAPASANPAADAALAEGRRFYELQEWDKAIAKFKEAYTLREDAPSLFNLAQSYRLKGDCASALGFYKTFKRKFPKAGNITQVEKFIIEMEACAKPGPVKTDPVKTDPVKTDPVKTDPVKPDPVEPDPVKLDPVPITGTSEPASSGNGLRIASYVALGAGGVGLILGGVFGAQAIKANGEAEDLGAGEEWQPGIEDRGKRNQTRATISLAAGGALVAGGVVMFLLSRSGDDERSAVSVTPTAEGAQLVWAGRF